MKFGMKNNHIGKQRFIESLYTFNCRGFRLITRSLPYSRVIQREKMLKPLRKNMIFSKKQHVSDKFGLRRFSSHGEGHLRNERFSKTIPDYEGVKNGNKFAKIMSDEDDVRNKSIPKTTKLKSKKNIEIKDFSKMNETDHSSVVITPNYEVKNYMAQKIHFKLSK